MADDKGFGPSINRLNVGLKNLKDGTNSCKVAAKELQHLHEQLKNQVDDVDTDISKERTRLADLKYMLSDQQLRIAEVQQRYKESVRSCEKVQQEVDQLTEHIKSEKSKSRGQMDSLDEEVVALSTKFRNKANLTSQSRDVDMTEDMLDSLRQTVESLSCRLEECTSAHVLQQDVKHATLKEACHCLEVLKRRVLTSACETSP